MDAHGGLLYMLRIGKMAKIKVVVKIGLEK